MTPEEKRQLKDEIMADVMKMLGNYDSIPFDVQKAFARRFKLREIPTIATGSKGATTENQAVDEAGSGTYSVLKPPDAFRLLSDANGTVIGYVPIWTS